MGDMFLILAPSRGFSMAANPVVSFALIPDRPWFPWQRKFENFNRKLAITGLLWEICSWFMHQVEGSRWRRINGVICTYPRPTLVAMATKMWKFQQKIYYNLASMGDMFLILVQSRGFSMAANPMVSFTLTPDRPWLPWQRKFENFNRKLAITELLWEICS